MSFPSLISKNYIINFIILLIPISYIIGNLALNLNIFLLILLSFLFFRGDVFHIKYSLTDKLILIFFLYILLNGFFNNLLNFEFPNAPNQNIVLIKSFLFLRFLILYLVVRYLVFKEIINYKLLFLFYGSCAFFVCFDLIIQYIFGKNLLGMEGESRRLSGIFGDEYIAGGFIQRFFIFLPYGVLFFAGIKNKLYLHVLLLFIFAISLIGVLASGNRIPLFFTILALVLIFIYEKKIRKLIGSAFIVFLLVFSFLLKTNDEIYNHFNGFKDKSSEFISYFHESLSSSEKVLPKNVYVKEFVSGLFTWQQNRIFGGGVKSFFLNCSSIEKDIKTKYIGSCNTHPHNYYLEIATSLGIIGLFLSIVIFSIILIKSITFTLLSNIAPEIKNKFVPFFIIFILEIFPLKTTGSFFTSMTGNFLFIILAFVVGLMELNKSRSNYEKK